MSNDAEMIIYTLVIASAALASPWIARALSRWVIRLRSGGRGGNAGE